MKTFASHFVMSSVNCYLLFFFCKMSYSLSVETHNFWISTISRLSRIDFIKEDIEYVKISFICD